MSAADVNDAGGSVERTLELEPEAMRRIGYSVVDTLVEHMAGLRDAPVVNVASREETESLLRAAPPEQGEPWPGLLDEFREIVGPRMTHVDHPRCFAFVPGAGTFVGAMGDALASGYNIYAGTWVESSAASQIELVVVDWFRSWLGLPDTAGGTLVSGGSVANLTGLLVAREVLLDRESLDRATIYASAAAHSSVDRAARVLGFRGDQVRRLQLDELFRLDLDHLRRSIDADRDRGQRPFCVVANAGATGTGAVDPLPAIGEICSSHGMWMHADAAYGGFAALDSRGRRILEGIERADSVALDPHKWFYTPFEAGCVLVRDADFLFEAFHTSPDYLADLVSGSAGVNFCDYGIQLSRATRALKIWLTVRHFGLARIRAAISRTMDLARHLEQRLEATPSFEITSPAVLGIVTFRYVPPQARAGSAIDEKTVERANAEILRRVWGSGRAMISSTRLDGRYVLRACVINHNTLRADVDQLVELLTETAGSL